jgi:hypothetical protein
VLYNKISNIVKIKNKRFWGGEFIEKDWDDSHYSLVGANSDNVISDECNG